MNEEGTPEPLGVSLRGGGVNVAVVSRHAARISVGFFDEQGNETQRCPLDRRFGDVHCAFVPGIAAGTRYALRVEGPFEPSRGHRFAADRLLVDPYAVAIDRPFDTGAVPKAIVSAPLGSAPRLSAKQPGVIYEIAVKAFTKLHPEVPEELRGTVAALGHPAIIGYLKKLGIDTVELMPIAAWTAERHLKPLGLDNAWGYNPVVFMAPDPRIAPGGIAEVRAAVAALHAADIRVILDVVYNHTGESDIWGETLSLRGLDNALYYRHRPDGELVNDTGCGNTLAVECAPVARLVMDSLRYWVDQTGVDGFRFDLAATLGRTSEGFSTDAPLLAAIAQDPILRNLTLIAEPWDAGPGGYRLGAFPAVWSEWNDRYRDDIRRFWRGDANMRGSLATRLAGSSDIFAKPFRSIDYIAAHDGFALADLVSFSSKHNDGNGEQNRDGTEQNFSWNHGVEGTTTDAAVIETRRSDIRALLLTLFASRGIPMLTAGDEFGRTQGGNNNAYAQDNPTTWLDWTKSDIGLVEFVSRLIAFRNTSIVFRIDSQLRGGAADDLEYPDVLWVGEEGEPLTPACWQNPSSRFLGMVLHANDERISVLLNGGNEPATAELIQNRDGYTWDLIAESQPCSRIEGAITLPPRSVVLLSEKAAPADGKASGADDRLIDRLAEAAGIAADWWDVDGNRTITSQSTKRALLAAMHVAATTRTDALASLADFTRSRLPAIHLHRPGQTLAIPAARNRRTLTLEREDGRTSALTALPEQLSMALPDLPIGYHRLHDGGQLCHVVAAPERCYLPEEFGEGRKFFGLAAHLYALGHAGDSGIGDFETLGRFGELTAGLAGSLIGINPLHHLFPTDRERASPYQPSDRRFIDPIYLSVAAPPAERVKYVDYTRVWTAKEMALRAQFSAERGSKEFQAFAKAAPESLRRHALFESLAAAAGTVDTKLWKAASKDIPAPEIEFRIWLQWLADQQLGSAARRGTLRFGLYRDLALGCAPDSGERWANPKHFADRVSIGAPPDPFSRNGQVWQLPPFSPHVLAAEGLAPMREIMTANMRHAGVIRVDHVLGFARQFWVPTGAEGKDGAYVRYPLAELIAMTAIESRRAHCAVIGEDLGTVPEGFRETLNTAGILSYKVLWFEKDDAVFRSPSRYPPLSAACISSHDLPTFAGWQSNAVEEKAALETAIADAGLSPGQGDQDLLVAAYQLVATAPSALMLVQADDLAGETEPLNVPGTDRERPNWRRRLSVPVDGIAKLPATKRVVAAIRKEGR